MIPSRVRKFWPFSRVFSVVEERNALAAQLADLRRRLQNSAIVVPDDPADGQVVAEFWNKQAETVGQIPPNSTFWNCPPVVRHINRIVCGEQLDVVHAGFHRRLAEAMSHMPRPRRAISIGCGAGTKEMDAIDAGAADTFECYDVSGALIEAARGFAVARGLSDRITYHHADVYDSDVGSDFDLVYWNNSLHHMSDARASVQWSRDRLRTGGYFAIDDYVGATRNQHSPELVAWCNRLLAALPAYLRQHYNGFDMVPAPIILVDPQEMARVDPSECADSGAILPAIRDIFPNAEIIKTGGAAFFVALTYALQNFRSETEIALLNAILLADEEVTHRTETQFAVVIAQKE